LPLKSSCRAGFVPLRVAKVSSRVSCNNTSPHDENILEQLFATPSDISIDIYCAQLRLSTVAKARAPRATLPTTFLAKVERCAR